MQISLLVSILFFSTVSYAPPIDAEIGDLVVHEQNGKPLTREDSDTDDFLGLSDQDSFVELKAVGSKITGRGEATVEDGGSTTSLQSIGPMDDFMIIEYPKPCQTDAKAVVTAVAVHSINFVASLPGSTTTGSISVSATTESLGIKTSFEGTIRSAAAGQAGTFSTTEKATAEVSAHGTTTSGVDLTGKGSTSSTSTRTVKIGEAISDSKLISKTVESEVEIPCGHKIKFKAKSNMAMTITLTELSDATFGTGDFTAKVQAFVKNEMGLKDSTVDAVIMEYGEEKGTIQQAIYVGGEKTAALVSYPTTSYVFNLPSELEGKQSLQKHRPHIFIPENNEGVTIQISSSNPEVLEVDTNFLTIPANVIDAEFNIVPKSEGSSTISISIPTLDFVEEQNIQVVNLDNIGRTVIKNLGDREVVMLQGMEESISFSRNAFNNIMNDGTEVFIESTNPEVIEIVKTPNFKPGQMISEMVIKGINPGSATLFVSQSDGYISIPITILVKPVALEFEQRTVPDWIKKVFIWYGDDLVSETEVVNALEYLVNSKIIILR